jgi:pyruvate,orthophosphate dikinase
VRPDISTADIAGLAVCEGIMTASGGRTAHAALVARQMGKACVVGCDGLTVDLRKRRAQLAEATIEEGGWLSIDGDSGNVFFGQREIVTERPEAELAEIAQWQTDNQTPPARKALAIPLQPVQKSNLVQIRRLVRSRGSGDDHENIH